MKKVNLHPIEIKIIKAIKDKGNNVVTEQTLLEETELNIDQVRRGIEWLKFKGLVNVHLQIERIIKLEGNGIKALANNLPERKIVNAIKEGNDSLDIIRQRDFGLDDKELGIAISKARSNKWIEFSKEDKTISITEKSELQSPEEILLAKIGLNGIEESRLTYEDKITLKELMKRPQYIDVLQIKSKTISITQEGKELSLQNIDDDQKPINQLTPDLIASGKWKEIVFTSIDVEAPLPKVYPGRIHPITDFISELKEVFISMGFEEIEGNLIQPSFWNFDALFTPQDHPAREMQDTFYLNNKLAEEVANGNHILNVAQCHEEGWKYKWKIDEAKRLLLRTHTTAITIKYLANRKPDSARIFSIGKVFRNEKVSYKHLVEFNQVEGIVTEKDANLRNLMGLQKEFYTRLGIKKVKFWPTFFPYTEPSLQTMIFNERLDKWVELFGMGIFRPEVTRPLGITNPVLAWGGGLERLAMLKLNVDDVRVLYANSIDWLRNITLCR